MILITNSRENNWRKLAFLCFAATVLTCFMAIKLRSYSYSIPLGRQILSANQPRISTSVMSVERSKFSDDIKSKIGKRYRSYSKFLDMVTRPGVHTEKSKKLPDMIVAGVEKCGTGALRLMLLRHPMIKTSDLAEMHYFGKKQRKSLEYYLSHMPNSTSNEVVFEKSPSYFINPNAAAEIHETIPHVQIVLVVCDPVNRTFSDYVQEIILKKIDTDLPSLVHNLTGIFSPELRKRGHDVDATLDFFDKMHRRNHATHIFSAGLYYYHLRRWMQVFNRSSIHIVDGEALISNPGAEMEKIQEFLRIPQLILQQDFVKGPKGFYCYNGPSIQKIDGKYSLIEATEPVCLSHPHKGRTRLGNWGFQPSADLVNKLRKFYEPYNKKLFSYLGRTFHWQKPLH